jgi:hypothetical protein
MRDDNLTESPQEPEAVTPLQRTFAKSLKFAISGGDIEAKDAEIARLTAEAEKLRKALVIYADERTWQPCDDDTPMVRRCYIAGTAHPSKIAQYALAEWEKTR